MAVKAKKDKPRTGRPVREPGELPTKERILDAAIELFADKGYAGTSVRDIARMVGLSEGALYKHYQGKEAILDAILDLFDEKIFAPMPVADPGASAFRLLLGGLPAYLAANPRISKIGMILMNEARIIARIGTYLEATLGERATEAVTALFQAEIDSGRIACGDARALANLFNALRFGWVYRNNMLAGDVPVDRRKGKEDLEGIICVLEDKFCVRRN